jgi:hypothetical protein
MKAAGARADDSPGTHARVLVLGATGRTGRHVVEELLNRGVAVRAIVRSVGRVPSPCADTPNLEVVEADILSLSEAELRHHLRGCAAVVSCLGHTNDARGVFGPPFDLVTAVVERVYGASLALHPVAPVKFVLMSSVSVNDPRGRDPRRSLIETAMLGLLRALVPPAKDNQRAADFLSRQVGAHCAAMEWVAVRPDSLLDGDLTPSTPGYSLHKTLVTSLLKPAQTSRVNVADFICDLVCDASVWQAWRGQLPVIVDTSPARMFEGAAAGHPTAERRAGHDLAAFVGELDLRDAP